MAEQLYVFVDKTGHCFEDFTKKAEAEWGEPQILSVWLKKGRKFGVGDMMVFRDELTDAGFEWGKDFYVKKV